MSGKVRFFLESSVKEIQDLKDRGIFDQDELSKIMKRRTEYEHRLLSQAVKPEDFLGYAKYEMQVDKLRLLRIQRLKLAKNGKKSVSDWAGPRRIQFTLERGTNRFPTSLKLWMALVDYAFEKHNHNVVNNALTSMVRMHPTNPEVWVYVAKFQTEKNSSIPEARAVLQRGLRFNADSQYLWLEYMRLELIYIAKILVRRQLLGISHARKEEEHENRVVPDSNELSSADLAAVDSTEIKSLPDVNIDILGDVDSNPALRGDVALAVYDAALGRFADNKESQKELARKTLVLFDEFKSLKRAYLCSHVIESMHAYDDEVEFWAVSLPMRHTLVSAPEVPDSLKQVFNLYARSSKSLDLKDRLRTYLAQRILEVDDADENLKKAVRLFESKM